MVTGSLLSLNQLVCACVVSFGVHVLSCVLKGLSSDACLLRFLCVAPDRALQPWINPHCQHDVSSVAGFTFVRPQLEMCVYALFVEWSPWLPPLCMSFFTGPHMAQIILNALWVEGGGRSLSSTSRTIEDEGNYICLKQDLFSICVR